MFARLMPKEGRFFDLFNEHAEKITAGGKALVTMMDAVANAPDIVSQQADLIDEAEGAADDITRETVKLLHLTFITPFDRDQIHQLINSMDDALDLIQDTSETISLYGFYQITPEARQLADIVVACSERLGTAVKLLPAKNGYNEILKVCEEIETLESEADHLFRHAMSKLFREEPDVLQLIKFKTLYELLEKTTDRCEDAGKIIEGIVLENA